jgi:hypothetical protein
VVDKTSTVNKTAVEIRWPPFDLQKSIHQLYLAVRNNLKQPSNFLSSLPLSELQECTLERDQTCEPERTTESVTTQATNNSQEAEVTVEEALCRARSIAEEICLRTSRRSFCRTSRPPIFCESFFREGQIIGDAPSVRLSARLRIVAGSGRCRRNRVWHTAAPLDDRCGGLLCARDVERGRTRGAATGLRLLA